MGVVQSWPSVRGTLGQRPKSGHQMAEIIGFAWLSLLGLFALPFCLLAFVLALACLLARLLPVFRASVTLLLLPLVGGAFRPLSRFFFCRYPITHRLLPTLVLAEIFTQILPEAAR